MQISLTPAYDSEAVDHGRMRVGADQAVWIEQAIVVEHDSRQVLEIDLMHDSRSRRNYQHVLKRLRAPLKRNNLPSAKRPSNTNVIRYLTFRTYLEELKALLVPHKLHVLVLSKRFRSASEVTDL